MTKLTGDREKNSNLLTEIINDYYGNDQKALQNIISMFNGSPDIKNRFVVALAECCLHDLNDTYDISEESIQLVKDKLFDLPNWQLFKLTLFANFMFHYDSQSNQLIIASILTKPFDDYTSREQSAVIAILVNFLSMLVDETEYVLAQYYINQLKKLLKPTPNLFFYHLITTFYDKFIKYKQTDDQTLKKNAKT